MDLFSHPNEKIVLPNAILQYIPSFFPKDIANSYNEILMNTTPWQQDDITVFGKTYKQPRLTAFMGTEGISYSYSNITMKASAFTEVVEKIKNNVEAVSKQKFNSVLLNLYRHGNDSNGWHADNEPVLGKNPVIASVSFGAERPFYFKHKTIKNHNHKLLLNHGSLLIMQGEMQHYWVHQIAKTKIDIGPRINLTFRRIIV